MVNYKNNGDHELNNQDNVSEDGITLRSLYENKLISYNPLYFNYIHNFFKTQSLKNTFVFKSNINELNNIENELKDKLKSKANVNDSEKLAPKDTIFLGERHNKGLTKELDRNVLSIRAYNICARNGITTFAELFEHYRNYGNFLKLRFCGNKVNRELMLLVNSPLSETDTDAVDTIKTSNQSTFNQGTLKQLSFDQSFLSVKSMTKKERDYINHFIIFLLNSLSIRTKNTLNEYYQGDFSIKNLLSNDIIMAGNANAAGIGVNSKRYKEIQYFYEQILKNISLTQKKSDELKHQYIDILTDTSNIDKSQIEDLTIHKCSGIKLIDSLLRNNLVWGDKTNINVKCLNIFNDFEALTLQEVGDIYGLTRERIRQIRAKGLEDLRRVVEGLKFFLNEEIYSDWSFGDETLIVFSSRLTEKINTNHDVSFSREFIAYLYSIVSDYYSIIPNIDESFLTKLNNRKSNKLSSYYLVNRFFFEKIDFESMVKDIKRRKEDKIEEGYTLSLNNFLRKYLYKNGDLSDDIIKISEQLIMEETGVFINNYNELEFNRNVPKTVPDYAYEILKEIGQPSKIDYMYEVLLEKYPEFDKAESTFRNSFNTDRRFVPIGRQSVWGLKEWESEREDFLGGTMLDMAEKLLKNSDIPLHISKITEEVAKYRDVDESRLMSNLRFNNQRGFMFFKKQYVGLVGKNYPTWFKEFKNENRSWDESYLILKRYLKENSCLPRSNNFTEESARIYRWYGIQKLKYRRGELKGDQLKKIECLINKLNGCKS